jgi:hypothetical protein
VAISTNSGFHSVIVPVLSKTTIVDFLSLSNHSAFFARIPFFAPCPIPVIIAIGVANQRPQGQAITKTPTKLISANCELFIPGKNVSQKIIEIIQPTTQLLILMEQNISLYYLLFFEFLVLNFVHALQLI